MKLYPVDVIDFQDMFPTEAACHEYLCLIRWPDGFVRPTIDDRHVAIPFHGTAETPGMVGVVAGAIEAVSCGLNDFAGIFMAYTGRHIVTAGMGAIGVSVVQIGRAHV